MENSPLTVIHSVETWLNQTEAWLYNQVKFLPAEVESHVVCRTTSNLDQFIVPNIHAFEDLPGWQLLLEKGLRKLKVRPAAAFLERQARSLKADVLHSHFGPIGWANRRIPRKTGMKHVVTFYGYDVNFLPRQDPVWLDRYREMFAMVDAVLCEGSFMAGCIEKLNCPPEKIIVQHLGVDLDRFPFKPRTWNPGEPLRVLIAASFREKKGIPYALEALGRIQDETPLAITVIGDANKEERSIREKELILQTVEKYALGNAVDFRGFQPYAALIEEAYNHHIFLSPSVTAADGDTEGGAPVSIIEMAATGMPVVSTFHCDIPGILKTGERNFLSPERDVGGIAENLRWLINNPTGWKSVLEGTRKHIEQEFNAVEQGRRLAGIYRSLL